MIYSIIRLLKNGKIDVQIVNAVNLNDELQCYQFEEIYIYKNITIFIMFDSDASGHKGKKFDFIKEILNDDELVNSILKSYKNKVFNNDAFYKMSKIYNVPFVLLGLIHQEIIFAKTL